MRMRSAPSTSTDNVMLLEASLKLSGVKLGTAETPKVPPPASSATVVALATARPQVVATKAAPDSVDDTFVISGWENKTIVRYGQLVGKACNIEKLKNCKLYIFDACDCLNIDDIDESLIVIAACENLVQLRKCKNTTVIVACRRLSCRGCDKLELLLFAGMDPVIEESTNITVRPYNLRAPDLAATFKQAKLDAQVNRFLHVRDVSADDSTVPQPHFTVKFPEDLPTLVTYGENFGPVDTPLEVELLLKRKWPPGEASSERRQPSPLCMMMEVEVDAQQSVDEQEAIAAADASSACSPPRRGAPNFDALYEMVEQRMRAIDSLCSAEGVLGEGPDQQCPPSTLVTIAINWRHAKAILVSAPAEDKRPWARAYIALLLVFHRTRFVRMSGMLSWDPRSAGLYAASRAWYCGCFVDKLSHFLAKLRSSLSLPSNHRKMMGATKFEPRKLTDPPLRSIIRRPHDATTGRYDPSGERFYKAFHTLWIVATRKANTNIKGSVLGFLDQLAVVRVPDVEMFDAAVGFSCPWGATVYIADKYFSDEQMLNRVFWHEAAHSFVRYAGRSKSTIPDFVTSELFFALSTEERHLLGDEGLQFYDLSGEAWRETLGRVRGCQAHRGGGLLL